MRHQGSSTLKVIWPDVLSAVRQGRLRQPPAGTWPFTLECYVNGKAYNTLEAYQGKGSSCFVYAVTLEPPRKVSRGLHQQQSSSSSPDVVMLSPQKQDGMVQCESYLSQHMHKLCTC
jgi:hypothetical protein